MVETATIGFVVVAVVVVVLLLCFSHQGVSAVVVDVVRASVR